MSLVLTNPHQEIERIVTFIRQTFHNQGKKNAVIAVSGGIDSALSLTLLTQALGAENVTPVFLPYDVQSTADAKEVSRFNQIPEAQGQEINIQPLVDSFVAELRISEEDTFRKGNIMARCRMVVVYDLAKKLDALVCGTENKSEKYLGYFTRFGDEASDLEPLQHLYKTQVRQLAQILELPEPILSKAPSAGLWNNQTDESELGYTYQQADLVLQEYIDKKRKPEQIVLENVSQETIEQVVQRVQAMEFKHQVPYIMEEQHV